jgi:phage terminase large subunit-like protein
MNAIQLKSQRLIDISAELDRRRSRRRIEFLFPDLGPLCRSNYPKHMQFFEAGANYRERGFMAANRVGKTEAGGSEVSWHLTGRYPAWWVGKRFSRPVDIWAAGDTNQTVKDILQEKLLGKPGVPDAFGTGLIPHASIIDTTKKRGNPDAIETIFVRHISGGVSILTLKSYEQGRESFQGTAKDVIWLDEEPPEDIYTECLLRTMTTGGIVMLTFTPLSGLSDVVLTFLPGGRMPEVMGKKFIVMATWDDAPHLDEKTKRELWDSLPPHQREARSKGIPSIGSGKIYPLDEDEITVTDFIIPAHWPRAFAMDVGWKCTAGLWGAIDRESDTSYLYSCYKAGNQLPAVHATAFKSRGIWIPGVIDPASNGRGQDDGKKLFAQYQAEGLDLHLANNAVESGIYDVWTRKQTGRLKVFKSLAPYFEEHRLYRRDDKGKGTIVKVNDHLMDVERYFVNSGIAIAKTMPVKGCVISNNRPRGSMAA